MSDSWRTRLGVLLLVLGVVGVILSFGPLQFGDRLSGRVDAEGVVQWGVTVDATSPEDTVSDGQYGAWKVDYEIDGSGHTGVIIGEYSAGQQILVSAPSNGSIYSILHEGTPTPLKVLSWFVIVASLAAVVIGGWWLARGLRAADARNREIARQQLARLYPQLFPPAPVPGPQPQRPGSWTDEQPTAVQPTVEQQYGEQPTAVQPTLGQPNGGRTGPRGQQRADGKPDFFAPYDI